MCWLKCTKSDLELILNDLDPIKSDLDPILTLKLCIERLFGCIYVLVVKIHMTLTQFDDLDLILNDLDLIKVTLTFRRT